MKLQKQKRNGKKKLTVLLIILVVSLLLAGGVYAIYLNDKRENKITNNESSSRNDTERKTTVDSDKRSDDPKTEEGNKVTNSDNPDTPSINPTTNKRVVQVNTSVDIANNIIFIRGGISNSVEYEGSCYASLTGPQGNTIRKDTTLLQNPTTTDCKTIQIPLSELSRGTWKFKLNFNSDQASGVSSDYAFEVN